MKLIIINGPNLNLLGQREPEVYGSQPFESYFTLLEQKYPNVSLEYYQSNIEGEIITKIQAAGFSHDGIILNAGAYTHTSIGIADAIKAVTAPVVEVHISNTFSRETFRHQSYISPVAKGVIIGFGLKGYELALQSLIY
jgi:3-dehydroquinate dehydratase-2